jgi:hypothetical protein
MVIGPVKPRSRNSAIPDLTQTPTAGSALDSPLAAFQPSPQSRSIVAMESSRVLLPNAFGDASSLPEVQQV